MHEELLSVAKTILENSDSERDNWQSFLLAIGYAYEDFGKCEALIDELFTQQLSDGRFSKIADDALLMLPFHGFLLWKVYQDTAEKEAAKTLLARHFPALIRWHEFLYTNRDPREEGIVYIQDPKESILTNSPLWQTLAKPTNFQIQCPFFNAVLTWSNEAMIRIGEVLKADITSVLQWHELGVFSLNYKLWDPEQGLYCAYDLEEEQSIALDSIRGILPLVGELPTQEQAELMFIRLRGGHFDGKARQGYFCPSYSLESSSAELAQIETSLNWMLYYGLLRYDLEDQAALLKEDMLELFTQHGFEDHFSVSRETPANTDKAQHAAWAAALCMDLILTE